ncbi:proline racemase family protein [Luteolibacter pohnpeiensis]|uniref:Proline racemase family protein n=1 Tax=Luteolibacter pohnpeiensis TaxID=454153 RepID=A0A934S7Y6_9BACT|nr:proline racemase family protein [Luteolibacter pohnpeiensis]MBK1881019.1 proline racemase family protein [Luteolibacter pohnpeiensis]
MSTIALKVIDSHAEGEPTRVVVEGGPDLGNGPMSERAALLQRDHDWLRSSVCNEPRGHEAMVGALLCEAYEADCICGVIFFNNVSNLNMCIHGTIGLTVTLAHLGKIQIGSHRIDTPVGVVTATLHPDGSVEVANVPSRRKAKDVSVEVPTWGVVTGDIAWGGNWFFLIQGQGPEIKFKNLDDLTDFTWKVRLALEASGITGDDGMCIDHIETFGPPVDPALAESRNFVLCPGRAYDRSPCGTGTSAKLACLAADGDLAPGQIWRQAGILNSVFSGTYSELPDGWILPRVTGRAWVTGESTYYFHPEDPFRFGIPMD